MSGKLFRSVLLTAAAVSVLAGCTTDMGSQLSLGVTKQEDKKVDPNMVVMQGACPQVVLREGTAVMTVYAKGAKKTPDGQGDPDKVRYQASLSETTRQCRTQGTGIVMTVAVAGRLVPGPEGQVESVNLPIRVAAVDGETTIYSELSQQPVSVSDVQGATQFIFSKADVTLPNGVGPLTKVYVGFDEGPYNTK